MVPMAGATYGESGDLHPRYVSAQAMAEPVIVKALEGKTVRKVIVREPKLVNVVAS